MSAETLGDVDGVGDVTEQRLNAAGISSIGDLADADPETIAENANGISASKAAKLVGRANEKTITIQTGSEVRDEYQGRACLTTGMEEFDKMLGDGWRGGDLIGISGGSDSGKTQLCFQSMVHAAEQTGDPAVYIETEPDRYSPDRLELLANEEGTQDQIHRVPVHFDLDDQKHAYHTVRKEYDDISIVVVDSLTANIRLDEEYDGRGTLSKRSTEIGAHIRGLYQLAKEHDCPILMPLQVYGNPSGFGGGDVTYGGELLSHMLMCRVQMREAEGAMKRARLAGHSGLEEKEVFVRIGNQQLEAFNDL